MIIIEQQETVQSSKLQLSIDRGEELGIGSWERLLTDRLPGPALMGCFSALFSEWVALPLPGAVAFFTGPVMSFVHVLALVLEQNHRLCICIQIKLVKGHELQLSRYCPEL